MPVRQTGLAVTEQAGLGKMGKTSKKVKHETAPALFRNQMAQSPKSTPSLMGFTGSDESKRKHDTIFSHRFPSIFLTMLTGSEHNYGRGEKIRCPGETIGLIVTTHRRNGEIGCDGRDRADSAMRRPFIPGRLFAYPLLFPALPLPFPLSIARTVGGGLALCLSLGQRPLCPLRWLDSDCPQR